MINGKFVAGLAAIALIFVVGHGHRRRHRDHPAGHRAQPEDVLRLMTWIVLTIAYIGFWLALALLCSVLLPPGRDIGPGRSVGLAGAHRVHGRSIVGVLAGVIRPFRPTQALGSVEQRANAIDADRAASRSRPTSFTRRPRRSSSTRGCGP